MKPNSILIVLLAAFLLLAFIPEEGPGRDPGSRQATATLTLTPTATAVTYPTPTGLAPAGAYPGALNHELEAYPVATNTPRPPERDDDEPAGYGNPDGTPTRTPPPPPPVEGG